MRKILLTTDGYLVPITEAEGSALEYDTDEDGSVKTGTIDLGDSRLERRVMAYRLKGCLRGITGSWLALRDSEGDLAVLETCRELAIESHAMRRAGA